MTSIENASVGDVLKDGSIVLQKSNGLALLVSPRSTEVEANWSPEFPEVNQKLQEQGFITSQWFVPTKEQLFLAYKTIPEHFSSTPYWSSTDCTAATACRVLFLNGTAYNGNKDNTFCVRAFRCVSY